jgi:hypothetical protein
MGRRFQRHEDWCPECGHLLPKKTLNCSFCGWSFNDLNIHDYGIDSWDDYSDSNKISSIEEDIDRLIDNSLEGHVFSG